ncbi:MAG TPA: glycosyl hydrolase 115 family protein [Verrucomicrobiae bacterium]|nr:glycosyl hydrolase 115 family protein [Verrucomicrobiae bacterium]
MPALLRLWAGALLLLYCFPAPGIGQTQLVQLRAGPGAFPLAQEHSVAPIYVANDDWPGVVRAARDFQADLARVTGLTPPWLPSPTGSNLVLVGTIGKSSLMADLIRRHKIDVADLSGKWEASLIQVVNDPLPGVARALVVAGSDKRGTIYGLYTLSEQMGVSPWYWWADVPVKQQHSLWVSSERFLEGPPAVQYRGIFLNDEAPALSGWSKEKFGGFNHAFYTNVFELLLRLHANFLWPAMWNNSFATDDPLNAKLADEYGIVMGTSHHEPMMRAWKEWTRAGNGPHSWDYSKNDVKLREFWTEGLRRTKDYEKIITLGMRGDGDEPMSETESVALLERIVADQRGLIGGMLNSNLSAVPQVWALYKEVQGYFERGMRVPDDVTLLWCDDNWGNLRRLPTPAERQRPGGAGIYYHFDYVGGPRNYKWLNTVPLPKIWEQMNLAYHYQADRIWIVNVGDLKPMEVPIEFFLTLAWDPERWSQNDLDKYLQAWAAREFGVEHAREIADLVAKYTKYNGRRKPELLDPDTFSLLHYDESERISAEWGNLLQRAEAVSNALPAEYRDAFFELVLHPIKACAILNDLYITAAKNRLYAAQGRASANKFAAKVRQLFQADSDLTQYYHHQLAGGKWNHLMSQTHIGYTYWQEPPTNNIPAVMTLELPSSPALAVAVEGSPSAWPGPQETAVLPPFYRWGQARHYIEIFNRGSARFDYQISASDPWLVVSSNHGTVTEDARVWVSVDWTNAPADWKTGILKVSGAGTQPVTLEVKAINSAPPKSEAVHGYVEADGYLAIEAAHYSAKHDTSFARWERLPDHGRTDSAVSVFPVTAPEAHPPQDSPYLEYAASLSTTGLVEVALVLSPSLNYSPERGVRIALSVDSEKPRVLTVVPRSYTAGDGNHDWEETVKNSVRQIRAQESIDQPGLHIFKVWMVDPGVVLQRVLVDTGGLRPSYLGPPESTGSN